MPELSQFEQPASADSQAERPVAYTPEPAEAALESDPPQEQEVVGAPVQATAPTELVPEETVDKPIQQTGIIDHLTIRGAQPDSVLNDLAAQLQRERAEAA